MFKEELINKVMNIEFLPEEFWIDPGFDLMVSLSSKLIEDCN